MNEETINDWISVQIVESPQGESELLGLQKDETWLVVVVDFASNPATNAWGTERAEQMLNQSTLQYIEELSGSTSNLDIHVHPEPVRVSQNPSYYGADSNGRDTDVNGNFLPSELASETVKQLEDSLDWSKGDLNEDGIVDRFLILHTTKGQEENPGIQARIWSHFTHFDTPISVSGGHEVHHYTLASLQTGTSGVGTILHEMMHQLGAVDLYPVHAETSYQPWKGLGDWDIMASGNWNGGGTWPALPSAASMELIGLDDRIQELDLSWPESASSPCLGPTVELQPMGESGQALKIKISEMESIFIEWRNDTGFDSRLPGHGVLVTYQDLSVGNFERNEVNSNPKLPWLMVLEADGNQDLVRGINEGEPSDLFMNGTEFGQQGVVIRTHDGVAVPWTASVLMNETVKISFQATNCSPNFSFNLPDHSTTVLPNDSVPVTLSGQSCTVNLTSTDGRSVLLSPSQQGETTHVLTFSEPGLPNSLSIVSGTVDCLEGSIDIMYPVQTLNRIPIISTIKQVIPVSSATSLAISLPSLGEGKQRLSVSIDGPLARIAEGASYVDLEDGAVYELQINQENLLSNNMLVRGDLILSTDEGDSWIYSVELVAQDENEPWYVSWRTPGRVLALTMCLLGIYVLSGLKPSPSAPAQKVEQPLQIQETSSLADSWDGIQSMNHDFE